MRPSPNRPPKPPPSTPPPRLSRFASSAATTAKTSPQPIAYLDGVPYCWTRFTTTPNYCGSVYAGIAMHIALAPYIAGITGRAFRRSFAEAERATGASGIYLQLPIRRASDAKRQHALLVECHRKDPETGQPTGETFLRTAPRRPAPAGHRRSPPPARAGLDHPDPAHPHHLPVRPPRHSLAGSGLLRPVAVRPRMAHRRPAEPDPQPGRHPPGQALGSRGRPRRRTPILTPSDARYLRSHWQPPPGTRGANLFRDLITPAYEQLRAEDGRPVRKRKKETGP